MHKCPCCSDRLLRHARHNEVYWFCTHCWQEMPDLSSLMEAKQQNRQQLERLLGGYSSPLARV